MQRCIKLSPGPLFEFRPARHRTTRMLESMTRGPRTRVVRATEVRSPTRRLGAASPISRTRFCRSVGLTPGIREACASVVGRIAAELLPRLERQRSHLAVRRIRLERELAHSSQLRRLIALAHEVAGILELELGRDRRHRGMQLAAHSRRGEQIAERHALSLREFGDLHRVRERRALGARREPAPASSDADARALGQCGRAALHPRRAARSSRAHPAYKGRARVQSARDAAARCPVAR